MIHHSNPTCDECGERHTDGNPTDCIEVLKGQIEVLREDSLRLQCEALNDDDGNSSSGRQPKPPARKPASKPTPAPEPSVIDAARGMLADYGAKSAAEADALCRLATEQADGSVAVQSVAAMRKSPALAEAVVAGLGWALKDLGSREAVMKSAKGYMDGSAP